MLTLEIIPYHYYLVLLCIVVIHWIIRHFVKFTIYYYLIKSVMVGWMFYCFSDHQPSYPWSASGILHSTGFSMASCGLNLRHKA